MSLKSLSEGKRLVPNQPNLAKIWIGHSVQEKCASVQCARKEQLALSFQGD